MKNIMVARCHVLEMDKMFVKFCFVHEGIYYDLETLNVFEVFDGENGIVQAELLNENELKDESRRVLNKRKEDLVNRLKVGNTDLYDYDDVMKILNCDNMSFVLYRCSQILLDSKANVHLEEIDEPNLGMMLNEDIYDLKTLRKVETMNDDPTFGDICLTSVKPIPSSIFSREDYMGLVLISNEIVHNEDKPKIIHLH